MNKKTLLFLFAVLIFAFSVLTTLSFFTDRINRVSVATAGNVSIVLYESNLHRTNNGTTEAGRISIANPDFNGLPNTAPENSGWTGAYFTDEQIKANANDYAEYFSENSSIMLPGDSVMDCLYVYNSGNTPAYVRIRVLIPAALDGPDGFFADGMYDTTPIDNGSVNLTISEKVVDGKLYNEYAFVHQNILHPGEMTFWNVWNDIKISEAVTIEDIESLIASGDIVNDGNLFNILIRAEAIQTSGFSSANEAFSSSQALLSE